VKCELTRDESVEEGRSNTVQPIPVPRAPEVVAVASKSRRARPHVVGRVEDIVRLPRGISCCRGAVHAWGSFPEQRGACPHHVPRRTPALPDTLVQHDIRREPPRRVRAIIRAIMVLFAAFCAATWRPPHIIGLVEPVAPFAVARVWIRQADSCALGAGEDEDRDQHRHDSESPHSSVCPISEHHPHSSKTVARACHPRHPLDMGSLLLRVCLLLLLWGVKIYNTKMKKLTTQNT
jgi:hypothetical protein